MNYNSSTIISFTLISYLKGPYHWNLYNVSSTTYHFFMIFKIIKYCDFMLKRTLKVLWSPAGKHLLKMTLNMSKILFQWFKMLTPFQEDLSHFQLDYTPRDYTHLNLICNMKVEYALLDFKPYEPALV